LLFSHGTVDERQSSGVADDVHVVLDYDGRPPGEPVTHIARSVISVDAAAKERYTSRPPSLPEPSELNSHPASPLTAGWLQNRRPSLLTRVPVRYLRTGDHSRGPSYCVRRTRGRVAARRAGCTLTIGQLLRLVASSRSAAAVDSGRHRHHAQSARWPPSRPAVRVEAVRAQPHRTARAEPAPPAPRAPAAPTRSVEPAPPT
jgi:hypothetical protein